MVSYRIINVLHEKQHWNSLPKGPTARKKLNAFMQDIFFTNFKGENPNSSGSLISGNPHGSAKIKWFKWSGYFKAYKAEIYPPKLCPNKLNFSSPIVILHCSIESTNMFSVSIGSLGNVGLELRPKPSKSMP